MHPNPSQTTLSTSSCTHSLIQILTEGNRDTLQKYLSTTSIQDLNLNQALFQCINRSSTLSHHEECLLLLLRADPNYIKDDRTPLMLACAAGQQMLVRRLLENGAKVDAKDSQGNYPLFYALNKNTQNFDVIEILIDKMNNVNIEIAKKIIPISFAIRKEFDRTVRKLLERNIILPINEEFGDTLLHTVCKQPFRSKNKQARIIKLLLGRISPSIKNKQGKTAAEYLHDEEMKQIIIDFSKPKLKEMKVKMMKKQAEEEEIDLSGDDLPEQNSPNGKMLSNIVQESDEEKKTEEKKDKVGTRIKKFSTTISSNKPKDLLKSITKSSSNQKFKQMKEVKETKQPKDKSTKYQRKKSSKNALVKTPSKQPPKQTKQPSKELKQFSVKQVIVIMKQQPIINETTNDQEKSNINKEVKLKQDNAMQIISKEQDSKEFSIKQICIKDTAPKQIEIQINLSHEAAEQKCIRKAEINRLNLMIQKLQEEIQMINQARTPEDEYFQSLSQRIRLSQEEVSYILTKQIQEFVLQQQRVCKPYYKMNEEIVKLISELLSKKFKDKKIKVDMYGSQSSGLCLQTSDLDLVIECWCSPFEFLQLIESNHLFNTLEFKEAKYIKTASVPIIKLQMSPAFASRRIDITFQTYYHNGVKCNNLLKEYLSKMDKLKPLVLVIKKLLFVNQLHDTYTGGLGSYSVVLLVIAFLQSTNIQKNKDNSLGLLLLQFLRYYGFQMDYISKSILVYSPQFQQIPLGNNIFQQFDGKDLSCKLILRDPLNPNNNVSRSTYKIKTIKQLLLLSYNKLFLNGRCGKDCKQKQKMTLNQKRTKPCCILERLFMPQILICLE